MGLFRRKKKEPEEYKVSEERIQNIIDNGVPVEVAMGTHGNDELIAGSMLGSTGKLIALNNYGKPIYKPTILFMTEDGMRFQLTGEFFRYTDIYTLEAPFNVGMINAEFKLVTTSGEITLKATNPNYMAIRELFGRFVALCEQRMAEEEVAAERQEAQVKVESDMDRLIRLGELHERGLLSDDEFADAKARLLVDDSDVRFCPVCGVEVQGDGNFCVNCGERLG